MMHLIPSATRCFYCSFCSSVTTTRILFRLSIFVIHSFLFLFSLSISNSEFQSFLCRSSATFDFFLILTLHIRHSLFSTRKLYHLLSLSYSIYSTSQLINPTSFLNMCKTAWFGLPFTFIILPSDPV